MLRRLVFALYLSLFGSLAHAQWELLPGQASAIGVNARGDAWVVGIDQVEGGHSIYRWTGNDWQIVPGGAVRIDVDPQGNPWVVNSFGNILRLGSSGWQPLPGLARDIGIGADGSVWVVGITPVPGGFAIYRWSGRDWTIVPGGAVSIDVDPRGNPWVVNDSGEVFRYESGAWQLTSMRGTALTVSADGSVWLLGQERVPGGHSIHRLTTKGWRKAPGGAVAISAGRVPWLVNSEGRIYRWETLR
ncbi:MAG: tectonin domain-containing protein [Burkholderiaceae bacterium]